MIKKTTKTQIGSVIPNSVLGGVLTADVNKKLVQVADGNASEFLQTDGSGALSWAEAGATPAGADTNVQYNDGGAFGGDAGFTTDKAGSLTLSTAINVTALDGYKINTDTVFDITGTTTTRIGKNASVGSTGDRSVWIGEGVGNGSTSTGALNVVIGDPTTGASLTSGYGNYLFGWLAGNSITTGNGNVCMGYYAGRNIIDGAANFALGVGALMTNVSGDFNVAIGSSSLKYLTADDSVAIGGQAMAGTLANGGLCNGSVAIGTQAMSKSQGNVYNSIGIGYQALQNINGANLVTAIGTGALKALTTGIENTAIGYAAGNLVTTGTYNVFIGASSGRGGNVSSCVNIGKFAGRYNATDNRLIIDNQDRTDAATEVTNAIIHGDMAATPAAQALRLNASSITFNGGADTDVSMNFTGTTNSGLFSWMEDEDYFKFSDDVNLDTLTASQLVKTDASKTLVSTVPTVVTEISFEIYDASPARGSVSDIHGALQSLATAQPLDSVPTDLVVTKGTGKLMIVINAGTDLTGDITVTGDTIDRNTGAKSVADTDTITVDALTTDGSDTDGNGNTRHSFTGGYITSKWFTGTVTLSTADLTLTDVDVYHVSFEQFNDAPILTLNTFDINCFTTSVNAEIDAYLYTLEVTGDKCNIERTASLNIGTDGETAIANKYWRLRKGLIGKSLNGTTDGVWAELHYANNPSHVTDMNMKVWAKETTSLTLT